MAQNDSPDIFADGAGPSITFSDLRGRQSVRVTFKLTSTCIEAISIVAAQLGIKQKSLFDHLFQDTATLSAIAGKVRNARLQGGNRVQKTYVISRSALGSLEEIARSFNAPRDALIEFSVQRLLPVIARERKRHAKRKDLTDRIKKHLAAGRPLLEEAYAELGEEDLLTQRLAAVMGFYESTCRQLDLLVEKGKQIEVYKPNTGQKIDIVFEEE